MNIMQGDAYNIEITLTDADGTALTDETVETVEVSLGGLTKTYPGEVTFEPDAPSRGAPSSVTTGKWLFPVTQEETACMTGMLPFQVRVKFAGGNVVGARLPNVYATASISTEVL